MGFFIEENVFMMPGLSDISKLLIYFMDIPKKCKA